MVRLVAYVPGIGLGWVGVSACFIGCIRATVLRACGGRAVCDNDYLQFLIELGPIGLLLCIGWIVALFWLAWRLFRSNDESDQRFRRWLAWLWPVRPCSYMRSSISAFH